MHKPFALRGAAAICGVVAATLLAAGCATPPPKPPRTTVVLLPDEDGNVGSVDVSTSAGSERVDQAYAFTAVDGSATAPTASRARGQESVEAAYGLLLKAQPRKPVTFTLHFHLDKAVLTESSRAQIPAVLAAVRERKPTEITVFGHADASGTEKRNLRISADRARMVADLLKKDDATLDDIDVQSFGDKVPLVPSDPRVPEPRNRRVEILIL